MISQSIPTANLRLHNGRLLLTPEDPMASVPSQTLAERLRDGRLIDTASATNSVQFAPGNRLFDYVGFTGCAVQLGQESANGAGIEIAIKGPLEVPTLHCGRNTRPPRCPRCRTPLAAWKEQVRETGADAQGLQLIRCTSCGSEASGWHWRWGRHGGYGRLLIGFEPVFPGEGRPLPALYTLLEQIGLGQWRYFYVQD